MEKIEYQYWLANLKNIGLRKIDVLLKLFGTAEAVYKAAEKELYALKKDKALPDRFSEADIETVLRNRDAGRIHDDYTKLLSRGIYFVTREDTEYPGQLRHICGAPYGLYVRGRLPGQEEKLLAVVGARDCSPYGREMAAWLAGAAAKAGIGIVSGLARGVDRYAHEGALAAGGRTYGVMGCGIDICYPREHINLYMEIKKEGGIISEYAPGTQPAAGNFPVRNRIISGLCQGILVVEARQKSGSLITVDQGLEQGKEIYALPGRAMDRLSEGCNNLIKMGAKLITSPKDILEDYFPNYEQNMDELKKNNKQLEKVEKIVYASLCLEPRSMEELARMTGLPVDVLMEKLFFLELQGYARQIGKNYYVAQEVFPDHRVDELQTEMREIDTCQNI
ncbi:DNA processing protein [Anaerotaenia torta]|uniref:DNA-processing protein DprA n=1 Tax=Anaerotaenia torta TaxID=433293 RepID=UPI003D211F2C